ncbi:MAG: MBL fold metallo-hydrolase, partial [bacterium]|nr:MBL fold metallo-hydrolase [bacterium]
MRKNIFLLSLVVSLLLLSVVPVNSENNSEPAKQLRVTFIDVKQGDSILIEMPNGKVALIDGGAPEFYDPEKDIYYSKFDAGRDKILPLLKSRGITKIDYMIGTHPDADHIGGLVYLLKNFPVSRVYYTGKTATSRVFQDFLRLIDEKNIDYKLARDGDILKWDPSIMVQVLHPREKDMGLSTNNTSVVIKLVYGSISFFLPGDAETEAESRMVKEYGTQLRSTILKAGHHGSKTANSEELLRVLKPEVIVISAGYQ